MTRSPRRRRLGAAPAGAAQQLRGALPSARHVLSATFPYQLTGQTPATFLTLPPQLSTWGNQPGGHANCVAAEEAFAKACYYPEIVISDDVVIGWAQDRGFLDGAVISDVLHAMLSDGFQQDGRTFNDGAANVINWTNGALLRNAISRGPVKLGVAADQLEAAATQSNGWLAVGFQPETAEDHCVSLCGYGPLGWLAQQLGVVLPFGPDQDALGYAVFTWGTVGIIDEPSLNAITHEAWVRVPTTIIR